VRELECPACGALVEGETDELLIKAAREHTVDAHAYVVSDDHVLLAARDAP
jgi:hypothetical protein